jgi:hypothetical protein
MKLSNKLLHCIEYISSMLQQLLEKNCLQIMSYIKNAAFFNVTIPHEIFISSYL